MRTGKVSGKRPLGLILPKITSERALPTSLPEYHACIIPDTEPTHGIDTGDPFTKMSKNNNIQKLGECTDGLDDHNCVRVGGS